MRAHTSVGKAVLFGVIVTSALIAGISYALTPDDPQYANQWYYDDIRIEPAWDITTGDVTPVPISIIGHGYGWNGTPLPDVDPNIAGIVDLSGATPTSNNDNCFSGGHTTNMASIIGAVGNNTDKIAGVIWNADITILRVMNLCVPADSRLASGVDHAVSNGAKIIYFDYEGLTSVPTTVAAVQTAVANKITVIEGMGVTGAPGALHTAVPEVVSVGSTRSVDYLRNTYSPQSANLDIVAPNVEATPVSTFGPGVLAVSYSNTLVTRGGNPAAAALVTGVLALLRSEGVGDWQARNAIYEGAQDLGTSGKDNDYGWGLLDAQCAFGQVGDMNDTNDVDTSDAQVILGLYGAGPGYDETIYDMNGDDYIDLADVLINLKFFGATC